MFHAWGRACVANLPLGLPLSSPFFVYCIVVSCMIWYKGRLQVPASYASDSMYEYE